MDRNYVITIARGFGSGGKEIGLKVAQDLGIPCYDRQLITMASDKSGIDESLFVEQSMKKNGSYLSNALRRIPNDTVLSPQEKGFTSDENLYNIVAQIIRSLAWSETCVIMGKCADHVLENYPNVLRLFVEAPFDSCVKSIMNKMHVTERRARQLVKSTDTYRSKYYSYYTGGLVWDDPDNYDAVLNSARIGRDKCAELIEQFVQIRFGITGK